MHTLQKVFFQKYHFNDYKFRIIGTFVTSSVDRYLMQIGKDVHLLLYWVTLP